MSGVVQRIRNQPAIIPRLLPAIDQLLIAGIKLGPRKKHDAINKILQLVPEWKRGDCWRRIRQLRRTSALATPNTIQDSEQPGNNGSSPRPFSRPWLPEDDDKLWDWAGYEPSHEDCPASWPFRPCRALPAWSGRHECKGQGRVVTARFAETPACEPCETPTPCRERYAASSRPAHHGVFVGGLSREEYSGNRHLRHPHFETCHCRGRGILLEASGQTLGHYGGKYTEPDFRRPTETDGYVCN